MKKIVLLVLITLLVAACGSSSSQTAITKNTAEPDLEPAAQQTEPAIEQTEESETLSEPASSPEVKDDATEPGDQTAVTSSDPLFPASNIADASIIRSTDHVVGAVEPLISIIEYGDFQ